MQAEFEKIVKVIKISSCNFFKIS